MKSYQIKLRIVKICCQKNFLPKYGYLPDNSMKKSAGILGPDVLRSALSRFQAFYGLNPTGQLDAATKELMSTPRCGVKDILPHSNNTRNKRFAFAGTKWRKQHLTYTLANYPSYLSLSEVEREIARAFKTWSDQIELSFSPVRYGYPSDIAISFANGEHGDGNPFDGPGNTLAHAYFPDDGRVHFDLAESWTIKGDRGTNFFQVAVHEIGHALGLEHSENPGALMYAFYRGYQPYFKLHKDDVAAIKTLYGRYSRYPRYPGYPGYQFLDRQQGRSKWDDA